MISEALRREFEEIRDRFPQPSSALIPVLHRTQAEYGYLSDQAIDEVADFMGMTPAEVEAVVSFYTLFRRKPVGKYVLQVCRSIACMVRGSDDLVETIKQRLGIEEGETTDDGLFTLYLVECVAACGLAPALQINLQYFYDVTPQKLDRVLDALRQGEPLQGEVIPTLGGGVFEREVPSRG